MVLTFMNQIYGLICYISETQLCQIKSFTSFLLIMSANQKAIPILIIIFLPVNAFILALKFNSVFAVLSSVHSMLCGTGVVY